MRLVTFLRDPTIPISVTRLNDLTGPLALAGFNALVGHVERVAIYADKEFGTIACR